MPFLIHVQLEGVKCAQNGLSSRTTESHVSERFIRALNSCDREWVAMRVTECADTVLRTLVFRMDLGLICYLRQVLGHGPSGAG